MKNGITQLEIDRVVKPRRKKLLKSVAMLFATTMVLGGAVATTYQPTFADTLPDSVTVTVTNTGYTYPKAGAGSIKHYTDKNTGKTTFCIQPGFGENSNNGFDHDGTETGTDVGGGVSVGEAGEAQKSFSSLSAQTQANLITASYWGTQNSGSKASIASVQSYIWQIITGDVSGYTVNNQDSDFKTQWSNLQKYVKDNASKTVNNTSTSPAIPTVTIPTQNLIFGKTLTINNDNLSGAIKGVANGVDETKNYQYSATSGDLDIKISGDIITVKAKSPNNTSHDVSGNASLKFGVDSTSTSNNLADGLFAGYQMADNSGDYQNQFGAIGVGTVTTTNNSSASSSNTYNFKVQEIASGETKLVKTATNPNYNKYISGAEYSLFGDLNATKPLNQSDGLDIKTGSNSALQLLNDKLQTWGDSTKATIKVGDSGVADSGYLNLANSMEYSWLETKPAKGFAKDPNIYPAKFTDKSQLNTAGTALLESVASKDKPIGELKLSKDDLQSGDTPQGSGNFSGTEVTIVDDQGNPVKVDTAVDPETGEDTAKYTISQGKLAENNGGNLVIELEKGSDGKYGLDVKGFDVSTSTKYGGKETKAPYGYTEKTEPVYSDDFYNQAPNNDGYFEQNVKIHDSAIRFGFAFNKTSDDQGEGGAYLNGAEFTMTALDGTHNDLGSKWTTGLNSSEAVQVSHDITDSEGFTRGGWVQYENIVAGKYSLVESKAPAGYKPVNPMEVDITPDSVATGGMKEYTLTITDVKTKKVLYTHTTAIDQENENGFGYDENVSMGKFMLGDLTDKGIVPTIASQAYNATDEEKQKILTYYQSQITSLTAKMKDDEGKYTVAQKAGNTAQMQAFSDAIASDQTSLSHAQSIVDSIGKGAKGSDSSDEAGGATEWKANQQLGSSANEKAGDIVYGNGLTPDTVYYYNDILFDQKTKKAVPSDTTDEKFVYATGSFKTDKDGNYAFAVENPQVDTTKNASSMTWLASIYSEKAPKPDGSTTVPAGNPVVYDKTELEDNVSETLGSEHSNPVIQTKAHVEDGSQLIKDKGTNTKMYDNITTHNTFKESEIGDIMHAYLWRLVPDKTGYTATKVATVDFKVDNQMVIDQMKEVEKEVDNSDDNAGVKYAWSEELCEPDDKTVKATYNKDLKDVKEMLSYPSKGGGALAPAVDTGGSSDNTPLYISVATAFVVLGGGSVALIGKRKRWF